MTNKDKNKNILKVILLGEASVGKTSLINVFSKKPFEDDIPNTISASCFNREIETKKGKFIIRIWDTAGQEKFRSLNKIFIKDSNIVLFVYDISKNKTFEQLNYWHKYTEDCLGENAALYGVVGNKIDLFDKEEELKEKNKDIEYVDVNNAKEFANRIKAKFCEASAKTNIESFSQIIIELVEQYIDEREIENKNNIVVVKNEKVKKRKCCK